MRIRQSYRVVIPWASGSVFITGRSAGVLCSAVEVSETLLSAQQLPERRTGVWPLLQQGRQRNPLGSCDDFRFGMNSRTALGQLTLKTIEKMRIMNVRCFGLLLSIFIGSTAISAAQSTEGRNLREAPTRYRSVDRASGQVIGEEMGSREEAFMKLEAELRRLSDALENMQDGEAVRNLLERVGLKSEQICPSVKLRAALEGKQPLKLDEHVSETDINDATELVRNFLGSMEPVE
jgi:hypothetical protein